MGDVRGYVRADGSVGLRNHVAVIASVICSTTPVQTIADRVPGSVPVVHPLGCAQVGDDLRLTRRILVGVADNPNVAAVLVVGLGCENNQPDDMAANITSSKPVDVISIQGLGGSEAVVQEGRRIVSQRVTEAAQVKPVSLPLSSLRVGVLGPGEEGAESQGTWHVVGTVIDRLVEAGASVTLGIDRHMAPGVGRLVGRAAGASRPVLEEWSRAEERLRWDEGHRLEQRPWSDDERRRAEALLSLTGRAPIASALAYGERPTDPGLHFMKVPTEPGAAMAGLLAGGVTLVLVASGAGALTGAVAAPTLVVAPGYARRSALAATVDVFVDGDVDASPGGSKEAAASLWDRLLATAAGAPTQLEAAGMHHFAIPQVSTAF